MPFNFATERKSVARDIKKAANADKFTVVMPVILYIQLFYIFYMYIAKFSIVRILIFSPLHAAAHRVFTRIVRLGSPSLVLS